MIRYYSILAFLAFILLSSFLSTINFNTYIYIHTETYIQLAFCIGSFLLFIVFILKYYKTVYSFRVNYTDLLILLTTVYISIRYAACSRYRLIPDTLLLYALLLTSYFFIRITLNENNAYVARKILYLIISAGTIQSLYGFMQLTGLLPNLFDYKLGGSFGNPGDLANFLALTSAVTLGLFFNSNKKESCVLIFLYSLQVFIIVLTMARTSWIATFLSNGFVLYHFRPGKISIGLTERKKMLIKVLVILALLCGPVLFYKLYTFKPASANGRLFIWELCLQSIKEKPAFGHGYESFVTVNRQKQIDYFIQHQEDIRRGWVAGEPVFAFNDYLQLAVEYGIIAVVLLMLIVARMVFLRSVENIGRDHNYLFISKISIFAVLICMLFSYPLHNPTILICVVFLFSIISVFDRQSIYELKLKPTYPLIIVSILIIMTGCLACYSARSVIYGLKWQKAYTLSQEKTTGYFANYEELFNVLKHDRSFLLNYGSFLYKSQNYLKCVEHFERYGYLVRSTDMLLMQGESYEKLEDYGKAEEHYQQAACLVPHKFIPKYKLFKLYKFKGRNKEAEEMAIEIRNMKIKVYSEPVKAIKTEINEYLLSKKNTTE